VVYFFKRADLAIKMKKARKGYPLRHAALILTSSAVLLTVVVCGSIFGYYYFKCAQVVDLRLQKPLFEQTAKIYAAPKEVRVGQVLSPEAIANQLRLADYSSVENKDKSRMGTYSASGSSITIHPGPSSYHSEQAATVIFSRGRVDRITGDDGQELVAYELEPQLITGLSEGQNRTKRRLITYNELPPDLVNAVTSIEDRRFFEHGGVDYIRVLGSVRNDLFQRHAYLEGGSTITMQLAKELFLGPEKTLKRKFLQVVLAFHLEHRFGKKQIFQMYANEIPLGQVGSFAINGFGQAAQTFFGKDVRQLDLAECALLAGMIQQPSYRNPYRHPARAIHRRNLVLESMLETGKITKEQAERAKAEELHLSPLSVDAGEAPYFTDLVRDGMVQKLGDSDFNHEGLRIYTSLDPDLQRVATETISENMKMVDEQVEKLHARRAKTGDTTPITYPQIALVALNPHTGQVLALVGGRDYGSSQLNHAVRYRPTGSIFKPFVYAAAFNSSLASTVLSRPPGAPAVEDVASAGAPPPDPGPRNGIFNALTNLSNNLTTFEGGYSPHNFHETGFTGDITARTALEWSQNNATVSLAQMVGYENVASLARDAGIQSARGTPAVALGAYSATPLEMAGAYTVFANGGVKIDPWLLASVHSAEGDVLNEYSPDSKPILDPRVAYLTLSLMENVVNAGTGAEVRSLGFTAPAAGKTGTSNDAWFAGFTSNLLCVVWIGNDDNSDLKLAGAKAAAPIWAEFMKRAVELPQYSDTKDFAVPSGVSIMKIDKGTNLLADQNCPDDYDVAFLDGTAPTETCDHISDPRNPLQELYGSGKLNIAPGTPPTVVPAASPYQSSPQNAPQGDANGINQPAPKKKKGLFGRILGAFKGDDNDQSKQQSQQPNP
jgi:penicillin-binding protein 1B